MDNVFWAISTAKYEDSHLVVEMTKNMHYCTTSFRPLAPTCFGSSLPSSGSFLDPSFILISRSFQQPLFAPMAFPCKLVPLSMLQPFKHFTFHITMLCSMNPHDFKISSTCKACCSTES
jgi:hypothetical protein